MRSPLPGLITVCLAALPLHGASANVLRVPTDHPTVQAAVNNSSTQDETVIIVEKDNPYDVLINDPLHCPKAIIGVAARPRVGLIVVHQPCAGVEMHFYGLQPSALQRTGAGETTLGLNCFHNQGFFAIDNFQNRSFQNVFLDTRNGLTGENAELSSSGDVIWCKPGTLNIDVSPAVFGSSGISLNASSGRSVFEDLYVNGCAIAAVTGTGSVGSLAFYGGSMENNGIVLADRGDSAVEMNGVEIESNGVDAYPLFRNLNENQGSLDLVGTEVNGNPAYAIYKGGRDLRILGGSLVLADDGRLVFPLAGGAPTGQLSVEESVLGTRASAGSGGLQSPFATLWLNLTGVVRFSDAELRRLGTIAAAHAWSFHMINTTADHTFDLTIPGSAAIDGSTFGYGQLDIFLASAGQAQAHHNLFPEIDFHSGLATGDFSDNFWKPAPPTSNPGEPSAAILAECAASGITGCPQYISTAPVTPTWDLDLDFAAPQKECPAQDDETYAQMIYDLFGIALGDGGTNEEEEDGGDGDGDR